MNGLLDKILAICYGRVSVYQFYDSLWSSLSSHLISLSSRRKTFGHLTRGQTFPLHPSSLVIAGSEEENKLRSTLQTVSHQHRHQPPDGVPPSVGSCYHYESDMQLPKEHHNDNRSTSSKKVSSRGEEATSPCGEASDEEGKYASSSTHRTTSKSTEKSDSDGGTQRERRKPVRA